jgi:hypothetical protein
MSPKTSDKWFLNHSVLANSDAFSYPSYRLQTRHHLKQVCHLGLLHVWREKQGP